jgi:hypothetical protein
MDPRNEMELCVFGIQRSGNHAIISWIMENKTGTRVHINNIYTINPYRSFGDLTACGLSKYTCRRKILKLNRFIFSRKRHEKIVLREYMPGFDLKALRRIRKDLLVLSWEDSSLNHPRIHKFFDTAERHTGESRRKLRALILRDPFNHFASLLESGRMTPAGTSFYLDLWKHYAAEFLGETSFLGDEALKVNYNLWNSSREYRKKLAGELGMETDGSAYGSIPIYGGGSSFQGIPNDAQELGVNERWKNYHRDPSYRSLFDGETIGYAEAIFGMNIFNP